jgi:hypothetical protein
VAERFGQSIEPPSVEVTYWHLDRFRLLASVGCGREGALEPLEE